MKNLLRFEDLREQVSTFGRKEWKEFFFLKDCDSALEAEKPENMSGDACQILNKNAVIYTKMAVSDEILVDLKGLESASKIWATLKATYENSTPVNQVHLMRKLVGMQLDESKSAAEHLSLFTGTLSQLQDSGMAPFFMTSSKPFSC